MPDRYVVETFWRVCANRPLQRAKSATQIDNFVVFYAAGRRERGASVKHRAGGD